jgi:hypothetical protein
MKPIDDAAMWPEPEQGIAGIIQPVDHTEPQNRFKYRVPSVIEHLPGAASMEEIVAPPGQRMWTGPVRNQTSQYEITVIEDSTFVTLEAEVARIEANPPASFYTRLHDINSDVLEGKLVVERNIKLQGHEGLDSVQLTSRIRKRGVPTSTIIEEFSAFDHGVERAFPAVHDAAAGTGAIVFSDSSASPLKARPHVGVILPEYERFDQSGPTQM